MKNEFEIFQNSQQESERINVPEQLTQRILTEQKPVQLMQIWFKLIGLYGFGGAVSLAFCPQFGFTQMTLTRELHHTWMNFGPNICAFVCGAFFVSHVLFLYSIFLRRKEKQWIYGHKQVFTLLLLIFSLSLFWMFNPSEVVTLSTLFWAISVWLETQVVSRLVFRFN